MLLFIRVACALAFGAILGAIWLQWQHPPATNLTPEETFQEGVGKVLAAAKGGPEVVALWLCQGDQAPRGVFHRGLPNNDVDGNELGAAMTECKDRSVGVLRFAEPLNMTDPKGD